MVNVEVPEVKANLTFGHFTIHYSAIDIQIRRSY